MVSCVPKQASAPLRLCDHLFRTLHARQTAAAHGMRFVPCAALMMRDDSVVLLGRGGEGREFGDIALVVLNDDRRLEILGDLLEPIE